MKISDIFEHQQTGPCKIKDWKLLYRKWNDTWCISEWSRDNTFRIYKTPRVRMKTDLITMKITISPEDAKEIIKTLELVQMKS